MSGIKFARNAWSRSIPPVVALIFLLSTLILIQVGSVPHWLLLVTAALSGILGFQLFQVILFHFRSTHSALEDDENYIRTIADLSKDLQAVIDVRSNTFLYMNQATEEILGFSAKDFTRKGISYFNELIHPDDRKQLEQPWRRLLAKDTSVSKDKEQIQEDLFRIRNKWDEYRWLRSKKIVIKRDSLGNPSEILMVAHDITVERSLETLLAKAQEFESMGLLARRLAHDLNNLLMGISGHVELALEHDKKPNLAAHLKEIGGIAERAAELCQQMSTYSGQGRLTAMRHNINNSIRDGLSRIESLVPENIHIALDLGQELPTVDADPRQIRQALLSLVMHSTELMGNREGEVTISSFLQPIPEDSPYASTGLRGDYICLQVADNGPGLSEEAIEELFDPQYRLKNPGNGLGMLMVQGIAKEHKGALHATSSPKNGSIFRLFFPLSSTAEGKADTEDITMLSLGTGAILLVDDEPCVRSILKEGLECGGYQVVEAADGIEGLNHISKQRNAIKMVLLDLTMPNMGGLEVFREIKSKAPEIPVVLMSGYTSSEALQGFNGLAGFLPKPCSVKDVISTAKRILD